MPKRRTRIEGGGWRAAAAAAVIALAAMLTACHGKSPAPTAPTVTEETQAIFLGTDGHTVQVQLPTRGSFVNQKSLPLDPNVKVTFKGKPVALSELPSGTHVTVARDANSRRVVRVDGE
jgi:hypothetical protein